MKTVTIIIEADDITIDYAIRQVEDTVMGMGGTVTVERPELKRTSIREFKVVTVSSNTNSFGLHGVVLMSKDGEAYEVGISTLGAPKQGRTVNVDFMGGDMPMKIDGYTCEIPRKLPTPPANVLKEVFKSELIQGTDITATAYDARGKALLDAMKKNAK